MLGQMIIAGVAAAIAWELGSKRARVKQAIADVLSTLSAEEIQILIDEMLPLPLCFEHERTGKALYKEFFQWAKERDIKTIPHELRRRVETALRDRTTRTVEFFSWANDNPELAPLYFEFWKMDACESRLSESAAASLNNAAPTRDAIREYLDTCAYRVESLNRRASDRRE